MIKESSLWSPKVEKSENFYFDIADSLHQGTRIFSRPLEDETGNSRRFFSFKGRSVSILYLTQSICREPFRLVKHLIVVIAQIAKTVLDTLNLLHERVRKNYISRTKETIGSTVGLVLRPIAFALDILRYLGATLVHPWIGIRKKDENPQP